MNDTYRIIGAEMSPYSVKVRSYFRFKAIPHQWIPGSKAVRDEYKEYFRMPLVPLVVTPDDQGMQDSTPIIEQLEWQHPENSIAPPDAVLAFLSMLLEEFADEWANKWMFHIRWVRDIDQASASVRLAKLFMPELDEAARSALAEQIRERMTGRVWFVGSNEQNAPQIEAGFRDALELLEPHLAKRSYLMGARPSLADFGLAPQLYCLLTDPTPGALITTDFPAVTGWIQRMLWPRVEGEFEPWNDLAPTLAPFLVEQVARRFLPWTAANSKAVANDDQEFSVELAGEVWRQAPQKYHAKSYAALREKYAGFGDAGDLDSVLADVQCLKWLRD